MKKTISEMSSAICICSKCSRVSLVMLDENLDQCLDCEPQEETSHENGDFSFYVLGGIGWCLLMLLL